VTKLQHYDDLNTARFITFNCYRNLPSLADDRAKQILIDFLDLTRRKHQFKILGYVIMPEHVHLVLHPPDGMGLGLVIREIKSRSAKQFFAEHQVGPPEATRVFWQRRCYDHNCRSPKSVIEKIRYCHNNPLTRGLVACPGDWKWSSYNSYLGRQDVPLQVDIFDMTVSDLC
jgi:putative transposase